MIVVRYFVNRALQGHRVDKAFAHRASDRYVDMCKENWQGAGVTGVRTFAPDIFPAVTVMV